MFRLVIMTCLLDVVIVDCSSGFSAVGVTPVLLTKGDFINARVCVCPKCPFLSQHTL